MDNNNNNNYHYNNNNIINRTPPCQNIMFPSLFHNPYHYQPLINIPTRTTAITIGEVGASVELIRAQVTDLSKRMDAMESTFSELKNSVSNDIFLLKNTLSEHSTELLNVRDCVENTHLHVKKTKEVIKQQNECIDALGHTVRQNCALHKKQLQQNSIKNIASNINLGLVRRRLSKVEDFTNDFYEQFESFKSIKEIIMGISDHINECDRDISSITMNKYTNDCDENSNVGQNDAPVTSPDGDLNDYFSKYDDDIDNHDSIDNAAIEIKRNNEDADAGADSDADADADADADDDDDFEKLL